MDTQGTHDQLVHSYDTDLRRIRCGARGQSGSTKHESKVTCPECLRLLGLAARARVERN